MKIKLDKYMRNEYSFKQLEKKIKLAIVNKEYIITEDIINHEICDDLFVVPVLDTQEQIILYNRHNDDSRDIKEIFNTALINTFEDDVKYEGIGKNVDALKFSFYEMVGDSYFLTSLILNPLYMEQFEGKYGIVFSMIERNKFHLAGIHNLDKIKEIINFFGSYCYEDYQKSDGKRILPGLFYYKDGNYKNILSYDDKNDGYLSMPNDLLC